MSFTVSEYSEKAIVLRGDKRYNGYITNTLSGKANDRLKGGHGWIFPNNKRDAIEKFIEGVKKGKITPESGSSETQAVILPPILDKIRKDQSILDARLTRIEQ